MIEKKGFPQIELFFLLVFILSIFTVGVYKETGALFVTNTSEFFYQNIAPFEKSDYSLFNPVNNSENFNNFSAWWQNFTNHPTCADCASFYDLFLGGLNGFLWFFLILFLIFLLLIKFKKQEIEEMEKIQYDTVYDKYPVTDQEQSEDVLTNKSKRWSMILELNNSENINDHKTAILDADILLFEILRENGYTCETLGEILKNAHFKTIQHAWDAHTVRNKIAHNPNFILTPQESKNTIKNFSIVFNEFYYL